MTDGTQAAGGSGRSPCLSGRTVTGIFSCCDRMREPVSLKIQIMSQFVTHQQETQKLTAFRRVEFHGLFPGELNPG